MSDSVHDTPPHLARSAGRDLAFGFDERLRSIELQQNSARAYLFKDALKLDHSVEFNGRNTKKWLEYWSSLTEQAGATDADRCEWLKFKLPSRYLEVVEEWEEFKRGNWPGVKKRLMRTYPEQNGLRFTIRDLRSIVAKQAGRRLVSVDDLRDYYQKFTRKSVYLKKEEVIAWQQESDMFLEGLPAALRDRYTDHRNRQYLDLPSFLKATANRSGARDDADDDPEREFDIKKKSQVAFQRSQTLEEIMDALLALLELDELTHPSRRRSVKRKKHHRRRYESSSSETSDSDSNSSSDDETPPSTVTTAPSTMRMTLMTPNATPVPTAGSNTSFDSLVKQLEMLQVRNVEAQIQNARLEERLRLSSSAPGHNLAPISAPQVRFAPGPLAAQANVGNNNLHPGNAGNNDINPNPIMNPPFQQQRPPYNNGGFGTGTNAIPLGFRPFRSGCWTCGEDSHNFREHHLCATLKKWIDSGIVTTGYNGGIYYRGERLPQYRELPQGIPNYNAYWESREKERAAAMPQVANMTGGPPQNQVSVRAAANLVEYDYGYTDEDDYDVNKDYTDYDHYATNTANVASGGPYVKHNYETDVGRRTRSMVSPTGISDEAPPQKRTDHRDETRRQQEAVHLVPEPHRAVNPLPAARQQVRINEEPEEEPRPPFARSKGKEREGAAEAGPFRERGRAQEEDEVMTEATTTRRGPKSKLKTEVEDLHTKKEALTRILETGVSVPLGMILGASPALAKAMADMCTRHRVPIDGQQGEYEAQEADIRSTPEFKANMARITPKRWYALPLGILTITIGKQDVKATVDSGSQINLMSEPMQRKLGLVATRSQGHTLSGITGASSEMPLVCRDVPILLGGERVNVPFFVSPQPGMKMILGAPFLAATRSDICFNEHGQITLRMNILGRRLSVVLEESGARSSRIKEDDDDEWNITEETVSRN